MKFRTAITVTFITLLLLGIRSALADPTYQYSKIILNPFYRFELNKGIDYEYTFDFIAPDGYQHTRSAIINFITLVNPPTEFTLLVNGLPCNTHSFSVSGSMAVKGEVNVAFDCSNRIIEEGSYILTLRTDKDTGFVYGWVDFVYQNIWTVGGMATGGIIDEVGNVKGGKVSSTDMIGVFGTEYTCGQNEIGTIFIQLTDEQNLPIRTGFCEMTVYKPDKTEYIHRYPLTYLNGSNGLYYVDFFVPNCNDTGVYMLDAYCYYSDIRYEFRPTNVTYDGDLDGTYWVENLYYTDCILLKSKQNTYQEYLFDDESIAEMNLTEITSADLIWTGQKLKDAYYQLYNYQNSSWVTIGEYCPAKTSIGTCEDSIWNTRTLYYNFSSYINGSQVKMRSLLDKQGSQFTDEVRIIFHNNGSVITRIRGGGELHVSPANISVGNISYVEAVGYVGDANISYYDLRYAGGTEYQPTHEGQIAYQFLRTIAGNPSPLNDADWCNVTVWYPNNSLFINNAQMTYLNNSYGLYYYSFSIPAYDGVYKSNAVCKRKGIESYGSGTFHVVSEWIINDTSIESLIIAVNQSVFGKLYSIQDDLTYINNTLNEVNETVHNITFDNVTVEVNLTEVLDRLDRNYNYSVAMNTSIWGKLYVIQDELYNVTLDLEDIYDLLVSHNTTVMTKLYSVQDDLDDIEDLIDNHNTTVMTKLYSVQDDLYDIFTTLVSHNTTVMNKLYLIQDEIADINMTLINATLNVTYPCEAQILCLLEHARILNKRIVNFKNDEYCINNNTLRHNITYEYCIGGNCRILSDIMDEECNWGCDFERNECNPTPTRRILMAGGVVFGIIGLIVIVRWFM